MRFLLGGLCLLLAALAMGEVTIEASDGETRSAVEAYLGAGVPPCDAPWRRVQRRFGDADRRVRDALDALGYFHGTFDVTLSRNDACWELQVRVDPGARAILSEVDVQLLGDLKDDPARQELVFSGLPEVGQPFVPESYERSKRALLDRVHEAGYLDAAMTSATVAVEASAARVAWVLDSGVRYRFGAVTTEQNVLNETLFRRYLTVADGQSYSRDALLETYRRLLGSDYYRRVVVEPAVAERAEGVVPVHVLAEAATKWSVLGGAGFATDTGPRLRGRMQARYLGDDGHRAALDSLVSPVQGYVSASYRWPYGDPSHQWYTLESKLGYDDTDSAESDSLTIGLHRTQRLGRRWTQTVSLDYLVEDFDVSLEEGRAQLLLLGHNLTYTSSIDARRPRQGRSVSVDVKVGAKALLSDNDVAQVRLGAKQILPLPWNSRLILRGQLGYSWQQAFAELPPTLRFFAGGDNSVRGYALDELGPEDAAGDNRGGSRLAVGSVEFDFPVRENWSAALFADTGSAWDDAAEFSSSVGFGVRWYSPLGPIRVDLAHPLDDDAQVVRLHLSIGPDI